MSQVPDFVEVDTGDLGVVGYIRSDEILIGDEPPSSPAEAIASEAVVKVLDVVDIDQNVIGHWVDSEGFLPLGEDVDAAVERVRNARASD